MCLSLREIFQKYKINQLDFGGRFHSEGTLREETIRI